VTVQDALAKIMDESTMPIGLGRHITDLVAFQSLLAGGSVNIVRPDPGLNSLTKIKRLTYPTRPSPYARCWVFKEY
jgi:L-alanine-DL-glutamate epimerase-like enolase superfamily enzyme